MAEVADNERELRLTYTRPHLYPLQEQAMFDPKRPRFSKPDKDGNRKLQNGHAKQFNEAAAMVVKIGTELAPYESPRLNAVALAAPGTPAVNAAERQRVTIDINIFDDKGDLLQHGVQDGIRYEELPLLEQHDEAGDGRSET